MRKHNLFLFLTEKDNEAPSNYANLNLARLYVNRAIIEEENQCEIQAVIPLIAIKYDNWDQKEEGDQDAVIEQLEKLGYEYFVREPYLAHFILDTGFHDSIKEWIYLWFNEQAVKNSHLNMVYNFICTFLTGLRGGICTYKQIVTAYKRSRVNNLYILENDGSITDADAEIPVYNDMLTFEQTLITDQSPRFSLVNNFNEIIDSQGFFYYKLLTESEIANMSLEDLHTCRKLGLKPNLDNIFRRISGRRVTFIITPKPAREDPYDQRLEYLKCVIGEDPIIKTGRKETLLYYAETWTPPVIFYRHENPPGCSNITKYFDDFCPGLTKRDLDLMYRIK